jgi:hypothetical protein
VTIRRRMPGGSRPTPVGSEPPPTDPTPILLARYGMAVLATEFPSLVAFEQAIETAVASGVYGSFVEVGRVPAIAGDWTIWAGYAPNDGRRRQLRARHVKDGTTASAYTSTVTVSPWTSQPMTTLPVSQGTVAITSAGLARFSIDGPFSIGSYRWSASTSAYPADATVAASGTVADGRTQNDISTGLTLTLGQRVYITVVPFSGRSAAVEGPTFHLTATRHDFTATKTVRIAASSLMPHNVASAGLFAVTSGYVGNFNLPINTICTLGQMMVIPDGSTLTQVTADCYELAGATTYDTQFVVHRIEASGGFTVLANAGTTGVGWETISAALSESTTNRKYRFLVGFVANGAPAPANNDLRIDHFTYTYTIPSSLVGI